MSVGQFNYNGNYIVDLTMVDLLSEKKDNIYIWCNADLFVLKNQLKGFFSGMFISELEEANYYDFWDLEQDVIDESNHRFSEIVSKYINEPLVFMYQNVLLIYKSNSSDVGEHCRVFQKSGWSNPKDDIRLNLF
jgi:hypothetical protein